jgi:hypothetical protein
MEIEHHGSKYMPACGGSIGTCEKKSSKPRKSTVNPKARPSALILALANMYSDPKLVNVASSNGMEDASVEANKKAIHTI